MSKMVAIKVQGPNGDLRRFTLPDTTGAAGTNFPPRWADVERQIATLHNITVPFTTTYTDEDNEEIVIDTDVELADLLASAKSRGASSIKFAVKLSGGNEDPHVSKSSVATFRSQASQNIAAYLPETPTAATLNNEGWKVIIDEGSSSPSPPSNSSLSGTSYGSVSSSGILRRSAIGAGQQQPATQEFGAGGISSQPAVIDPFNPFVTTTPSSEQTTSMRYPTLQEFELSTAASTGVDPAALAALRRPPTTDVLLGASSSQDQSEFSQSLLADLEAEALREREKQRQLEAELLALLEENRRALEDQRRNPTDVSTDPLSNLPANSTSATSSSRMPADVQKFFDQVRSILARYPNSFPQLAAVVEQQIRTNVHTSLEIAMSQIQAALSNLQKAASAVSTTSTADLSKMARDATYRAAVEANNASRRAYEEARSAARAAREMYKSRKTGATAPISPQAGYASQASAAASQGYGLGLPTDPRWSGAPSAVGLQNASSTDQGFSEALVRLREMGFLDDDLNRDLLAENAGDVGKVVEALSRLGLSS
ncbi:hypothetical protein DFJ73DRAFT_960047 [Zopfochytrium polystomum]|nr:hypothetical protein DFJ73DRAFT_960047 [Zopfochytrium polystomum]